MTLVFMAAENWMVRSTGVGSFTQIMYFASKWEPCLIKNGRRFLVDAIFLLSGYFSSKRKGHVHRNFDKRSFLISPCIQRKVVLVVMLTAFSIGFFK